MGIQTVTASLLICDECQRHKLVRKPTKREVLSYAAKSLGWFVSDNLLFCANCKAKMKNDLA
jgi:hypothetical protein